MAEDPQHEEAVLPEDAVQDLAPEDAEDVAGGAIEDIHLNNGGTGMKVAPEAQSFQWGVG